MLEVILLIYGEDLCKEKKSALRRRAGVTLNVSQFLRTANFLDGYHNLAQGHTDLRGTG